MGDPEMYAIDLIDRLLVERPGTTVIPGRAETLAISDRDRLLAAIYTHHFGDRVDGSQRCRACDRLFEVTFSLAALASALEPSVEPDDEGVYRLADGRRFRLPTTVDRRRCIGLDADTARRALLDACLVDTAPEGGDGGDGGDDEIQTLMEQAGPVLDLDLDATCPSCGEEQSVRFDIVAHLCGVVAFERRWLVREVHCLARAYGWGLDEILSLPRSDRRAYVRLNEARAGGDGW